jgi:hypothetical protein
LSPRSPAAGEEPRRSSSVKWNNLALNVICT